jgi:membrane protease YdiL (CAAX protease family)
MGPSRFPIACFFLLVFALEALGMCLFRFLPTSPLPHILWPFLIAPSLVGLFMILWLDGLPGIRSVIHKFTPWAVGRAWPMLAVCLLLPLACMLLTLALLLLSRSPTHFPSTGDLGTYLYDAIINFGFIGPGLREEIGWRGFVLPRLQRRYSAFTSSLIIGLVWALWHVPFFLYETPFPWAYLALFIPQVLVYSVIFTWVYNMTHGSLFAAILLHGAINAEHHLPAWHILPHTPTSQLLVDSPFLFVAVALLWRYGPSNLSLSNRITAQPPATSCRSADSDRIEAQTSTSN